MADIFNMLDTWNASGTTFTGIGLNVTDTASAAGSLLMDLQVGGVSQLSVAKNGSIATPLSFTIAPSTVGNGNIVVAARNDTAQTAIIISHASNSFSVHLNASAQPKYRFNASSLTMQSNLAFSWAAGTDPNTVDLSLFRDAANTLAQRNGVNAQAFNLYNTYTDASNYERGFMRFVSNRLEIGVDKLGTGATRHIKISPDGVAGVGLSGGNATTTHAVACGDSTASAFYAFAAVNGVASGVYSAAIGRAVTASASASVAMGYFTNAYQANQYALGFSQFTSTEVNQTSTFVLNASTTNATATEMGTGAVTFARMVVRASTTWAFDITVAARSDGGVDNATYMYRGMVKRDASNNTVLVGTVDNFYTNETNAAWDVAVTADDTTESLKITVTGAAATNINWTAKVILTEVGNV